MYSTLTDLTRRGSRLQYAWLAAAALLAAGVLRLVSLPAMNNDMLNSVIPWYTYLAENGRVAAWGDEFSNYAPGYIYLLTAATYLPLPALAAIKVLSISFDLLGACFAYLIVARRTQTGPLPVLAGLLVLLAPTVWVNSAYWGQADMIYTALLLGTVYFALARRPLPAMLAFGLALAIKLQAMFLAPWVLLLVLRGRIPWKTVFVVPLVFFASLLPAAALGRPLGDMLTIYLEQATLYQDLNKNIANLYVFVPDRFYDLVALTGLVGAVLVALGIAAAGWRSRVKLSDDLLLLSAVVSVAVMPFVLPKMHDRYFFPADVLSILLLFSFPRLRLLPLAFQATSLSAYLFFLAGRFVFPLEAMALVNLVVIGWLVIVWLGSLYPHSWLAPLAARFNRPAAPAP